VQYKKLGRYELLRVLGKGAMGVVYEGRDPNLDRRVAIKTIMVDDLGPDAAAEYEARFRIEARSAARLQHPNIVTVYDSDRHADTAYLVMEFIQGEDLKHHLDRGLRPTPEQALHLICDLLAALDFAHRQGVVHRDIKPANLLIEADGRVKLTDFGVARISGEATRTQGSMIGTLKYMAPEQVQGLKVDTRADLFSAAVVAYQLLAGVRPFEGDNDFTIIHQIIGQTPARPSTLQASLPPGTDDVLLRALAKNRDDRYQTAGEFSAALQAAFGTMVPGLTTQPGRGVPGFAAAIAAGAAAGLAVAPSSIRPVPTLPGTGINQELELEYWRAVRDSAEPKELEGFLARFPQGIYADLARRRLQRLAAPADPDQTVLQGMTRPPGATLAGLSTGGPVDDDATREPTVPLARGTLPPPVSMPAATRPPMAAVATPAMPPAAAAVDAPSDEPTAAADVAAPSRKVPVAALAAVGVAVLAAAAWFATRPEAGPALATAGVQNTTVAAAPAVAAPDTARAPAAAPTAPVTPAVAVASGIAAAPAASAARPASAAAAAASKPIAAPARKASAASSAPRAAVAPAAITPSGAPEPATPAPRVDVAAAARPSASRLVSPAETCKDRSFIAKPMCLHTECSKPEYNAFPFCVRLRDEQRQKQIETDRAQQTR
jgi:predicted Ser/Thr protein kinase